MPFRPLMALTHKRLARLHGVGLQYAALPYRIVAGQVQILLITSRETRRWTVPKGWPMRRLAPHQAAEREALEEAGVAGDVGRHGLGAYHYRKRLRDGVVVVCTVEVFPLAVAEELRRWREMDERERQWFTAAEAAARVFEPELKALILAFDPRTG